LVKIFFKSTKKYGQFYKKYVTTKSFANNCGIDCNQFIYNDKVLNDGLSTANAFNEYFTSFEAPNAYKKSECSSFIFDRFKSLKKKFFKKLNKPEFQKFKFKKVSAELVEKIISELDNASSSGITDIPISIIKYSSKILSQPISDFINFCLMNNCIPNEWKFAFVTPLYKNKGDLSDFNCSWFCFSCPNLHLK